MHDYSLGGPVDVGEYAGPMLDGKPLHRGSCEDGVYGCTMCHSASKHLTEAQLKSIGFLTHQNCDWCKKSFPVKDISGIRPWDEPSCYYQVCNGCRAKHNKELQDEIAYDDDKYGDDLYDD